MVDQRETLELAEARADATREHRRVEQDEDRGENVGLASVDGLLVWGTPVADFELAFRKIRRSANVGFHLAIIIASVATLIAFGYNVAAQPALNSLLTVDFWLSGSPAVALFAVGIILDCFLIFRLTEFSVMTKQIPGWNKGSIWLKRREESAKDRANHRFDVSEYFTDAAWETLGGAYRLAKHLKRNEIGIPHLFAAALASDAGARFLLRVGVSFDRVKEPIAALLRTGAVGDGSPPLSKEVKRALISAYEDARSSRRKNAGVAEIFLAAFAADERLGEVYESLGIPPDHVVHAAEWIRLREKLRDDHERFVALAMLKPKRAMNRSMTARATPLLERFSEDLTVSARNGYLAPLIGRDREMGELLRAVESGNRSVILVGERGVGKRAIVEGLARRMVEEDVPEELFDRRLISVNIAQVVAAGDPALASERFLALLDESAASGNIILVLEGIEGLAGAGAQGTLDLMEILAAELSKNRFLAIATATPQGYTRYIERRTLGAKLVRVDIPELPGEETIRVLMAKSGAIEYQNNVFFTFAAIDRAVNLSARYIHGSALPDKALDVIREAAVLARKKRGDGAFVTQEEVATIVHDKTNIPVEAVTENEAEKLLSLEKELHERIIGQDAAVVAVAQAMRRARAELREGKRPIANFLFLGPTGVGKTELSKALAAEYFGDERNMIRLDMSEYQDAASVQKMIGAANDERGGLLTEAVRRQPFAIVLLDEIEKANPDILNLFLQVMDDGRLTDGVGRTIDFTNVVLIATSNAGTGYIQEEVKKGTELERIKTMLLETQLKGIFRPEFLNRFDAVIVFAPLTIEDVEQIAWLMLRRIEKSLTEKHIGFRAEDEAVAGLAREGFDPLFGARPLRRVIQDRVDNPLADLLLKKEVDRRDTVVIDRDGTLKVEKAKPIG